MHQMPHRFIPAPAPGPHGPKEGIVRYGPAAGRADVAGQPRLPCSRRRMTDRGGPRAAHPHRWRIGSRRGWGTGRVVDVVQPLAPLPASTLASRLAPLLMLRLSSSPPPPHTPPTASADGIQMVTPLMMEFDGIVVVVLHHALAT